MAEIVTVTQENHEPAAYARINAAAIRQGMLSAGQDKLAALVGVDQSTIHRFYAGESKINTDSLGALLAGCGLRLVPVSARVVEEEDFRFFVHAVEIAAARFRNGVDGS